MADYALQYNGVLLQSACPKAQVTDITVQPIPIEFTKTERVASNGSLLVRRRLRERTVTINIELPLDANVGMMTANARRVRNWAEAATESPLILPDYDGKYLISVLTSISNFSLTEWYKPLQLVFTAFSEPCFLSAVESTGKVGNAITVAGDEYAEITIEHKITQTLTNPTWTLAAGYVIALVGTFSSGIIKIDCQKGYVSKDGESLMAQLQPSSRFYRFPKGNHVITGPSGGTITWRERWHD